jgi:hypothetical protein
MLLEVMLLITARDAPLLIVNICFVVVSKLPEKFPGLGQHPIGSSVLPA